MNTFLTILLALCLGSASILAIWRMILLRQAMRFNKAAKARKAGTERGLAKAGLLRKAFDDGFNSRNGEVKWYALYVDGRNEKIAELEKEIFELKGSVNHE